MLALFRQKWERITAMPRFLPLLTVLSVLAVALPTSRAEDASTAQELKELRGKVEEQSKEIKYLTDAITRLVQTLSANRPPTPPPAAESTPATESPNAPSESKPAADTTSEAPKAEAVPKAESAAGGNKHTVAKGETLTSIAKHYNIPLVELQKANKIENERKLQIGQVLTIPLAKTAETPEKKENP